MKIYYFNEQHYTGGDCTIKITEEQIIKYMKQKYLPNHPEYPKNLTNKQLITTFCILNSAYQKED